MISPEKTYLEPVIVTQNLTKRYGARLGLDGLSLELHAGEILGFLGPNGSGKSTAIRLIMGLIKPTSGKAALFGRDCWSAGHVARAEVGYLPGDVRLYPWLTLHSGVRIWQAVRKRPLGSEAFALAERFGLEPDLRVDRMSRGTRQKLGLILALMHDPKVLVLDEPTSTLDPIVQQSLFDLLQERAENGTAVFFSSHTLSEVEALCDRVAILRRGKLVMLETMAELRGRAQRRVTIRWSNENAARTIAPPDELSVVRNLRGVWEGHLTGGAPELARWCATQPISDISIEQPQLETVFRSFYLDDEEAR